jgi:hypothetical protein
MSRDPVVYSLAEQYAAGASDHPISEQSRRNASRTLAVLEAIGVTDAETAAEWRARIERLGSDPGERALLSAGQRALARRYLATRGPQGKLGARRALMAVGALTWSDLTERREPHTLVVDRVVAAPRHAPSAIIVSSAVLYERAIGLHWYLGQESWRAMTPRLPSLVDDLGTSYLHVGGPALRAERYPWPATSVFTPAPPSAAAFIEVRWDEQPVVRVRLR